MLQLTYMSVNKYSDNLAHVSEHRIFTREKKKKKVFEITFFSRKNQRPPSALTKEKAHKQDNSLKSVFWFMFFFSFSNLVDQKKKMSVKRKARRKRFIKWLRFLSVWSFIYLLLNEKSFFFINNFFPVKCCGNQRTGRSWSWVRLCDKMRLFRISRRWSSMLMNRSWRYEF